jgi:lipopolysaccharide/colanic/teichoic acid biosynthesis glycosyltransferase
MKANRLLKYIIRFTLLQFVVTYITIYYFDNYLIPDINLYPDRDGTFRQQIDANLLEDALRFFPNIGENFVKLDIVIALFVFMFLVFLYSTKFYTYVNELSFSIESNYLDEYLSLYLTWTSSLMIFVTMFRIGNLVSRGNLLILTFLMPVVLLIFRNSEFLSSMFGRSVTGEKYITFNLKEDSVFRNLRILTFRKKIKDVNIDSISKYEEIINTIDSTNKIENVNLIVLNFENIDKITKQLENYLINLNKKVLIISKKEIRFSTFFISRVEKVSGHYLTYFNNDIQYGSKYILKRSVDILLSVVLIVSFSPVLLLTFLYILYLDGYPIILKQNRVGLHGADFKMFKFRTMKNNSHSLREELNELNKNDAAIFKIDKDPRIIKGAEFLRKFSIDELPQLWNVLFGQMSIVGPRPLFTEDTQLFDKNYMRRLNVLPGITGLLQINERNTSNFSTWYKYDIEYIENWSIYLDFKIMIKTPFALFGKKIKGL